MLMSHYLLFMYLLKYFKKEVLSLGDYLISVVVDILDRKKKDKYYFFIYLPTFKTINSLNYWRGPLKVIS